MLDFEAFSTFPIFLTFLIRAANILGVMAFFAAIVFFLRLLYGPKGLFRGSIPKEKERDCPVEARPEDSRF